MHLMKDVLRAQTRKISLSRDQPISVPWNPWNSYRGKHLPCCTKLVIQLKIELFPLELAKKFQRVKPILVNRYGVFIWCFDTKRLFASSESETISCTLSLYIGTKAVPIRSIPTSTQKSEWPYFNTVRTTLWLSRQFCCEKYYVETVRNLSV